METRLGDLSCGLEDLSCGECGGCRDAGTCAGVASGEAEHEHFKQYITTLDTSTYP
jgi:hypothetical protein